ncbi:MAG: gluconate 2-dehydrogenase subunit 3 family protein [Gammaproteobacteria bacterium]|nr:gluconate 2-dehydrogenase subunit 3 family protein [Gammaproteobacteria bacterium]
MNRQSKKQTDKLLIDWETSLGTKRLDKLARLESRRHFLTGMLKSGAVVSALPLFMNLSACDRKMAQQTIIEKQPWQTFAAVQQQLFPDDGNGPSASDLNAAWYLKFVMEAPDTDEDDKTFLLEGVTWLNALTDKEFGKAFISITSQQKNIALKTIANSRAGERWLSHLILYLMEALLSDPVYGGNPNGIGWQWLEHQAGFPVPPKDKRYPELL